MHPFLSLEIVSFMTVRTKEDLEALRRVGKVVAETLNYMRKAAVVGISTAELDRIGFGFFSSFGARSAPMLSYKFPGYTCISVGDEIAHGIPGERRLKDGDLINIDVSLELDGYFADTGASFLIGSSKSEKLALLLETSALALKNALSNVYSGNRMNDIGKAVEYTARQNGFKVIRSLCGHGVGSALHEEPFDILNYYEPRDRRKLQSGQVIAIETFVSTGAEEFREDKDGWTLRTPDGSFVAQFEHSVIVTDSGPLILTAA